ncbi:MAG TPA: sugar phosphate nucleotidyltransferase [Candidatus Dojkabacteria bacterium]|nr:sugar phosphate nucleotidyltransferase [Candidatus Dojkabacteria bacterium]
MKLIVMAGGIGSKLWPVSRDDFPKQFIPIIDEKTLFQLNVEALLLKYKPSDIFISIAEHYIKYMKEQAPMIPEENYIIEPQLGKGTGPASGFAMLKVGMKYPDEVVMFYVQPVVVREPAEKYVEMIDGIEKTVKATGKFVTGGRALEFVDVGSDSLQLGKKIETNTGLDIYEISKFVHIVDRMLSAEEAQKVYMEKDMIVHCNHYTWTPNKLLNAFKEIRSDWYDILMEIKKVIGTNDEYEKVCKIYSKFEVGRIEELTETLFNTNRALVVKLPFYWEHITTWENVYQYLLKNNKEKIIKKNVITLDCNGNLVMGDSKRVVAMIDVNNTVVIDTNDTLFICPRNKVGKIKELLTIMEKDPILKDKL